MRTDRDPLGLTFFSPRIELRPDRSAPAESDWVAPEEYIEEDLIWLDRAMSGLRWLCLCVAVVVSLRVSLISFTLSGILGPIWGAFWFVAIPALLIARRPLHDAPRKHIFQIAEDPQVLDDPSDPSVCFVRVEIVRSGEKLGQDLGAAWVEEGNLYFSGEGCSFSLGGEDVVPACGRRLFSVSGQKLNPDLVVPLFVPSGEFWVIFTPCPNPFDPTGLASRQFTSDLGKFKHTLPRSTAPRMYPPMTPRPTFARPLPR